MELISENTDVAKAILLISVLFYKMGDFKNVRFLISALFLKMQDFYSIKKLNIIRLLAVTSIFLIVYVSKWPENLL